VIERFWPIAEPAQADYERLRAMVSRARRSTICWLRDGWRVAACRG
jgi:hypothetical protein